LFKRFLQDAFDFFLFSSLFISLCAVVMVYQTHQLLLHSPPSTGLLSFVFFSTVCSYNFHWYLTPYSVTASQRIQWAQKRKGWHLAFYFIGLIGAFISVFTIWQHWVALSFAAFVTFLYSAPKLPHPAFHFLRRIAIGKTIFLAFVWMYVTSVLPILVSDVTWKPDYWLFCCSRFFLIYSICILFDYRDRQDDLKEGIRSLITVFDERGINRLFFLTSALFFLTTAAMTFFGYSIVQLILLLIPGGITVLLYRYSKRNFSDYLYYFVLDGLMGLSGLLMLFFRF
jgi:4-hydroxybenzoate polyprenyltransferase